MRTLLYLIYFLAHIELQSGAEPEIYGGMISHNFTLSCQCALSCQAAIVCLSHNLSMSSVNHFQNNSSPHPVFPTGQADGRPAYRP